MATASVCWSGQPCAGALSVLERTSLPADLASAVVSEGTAFYRVRDSIGEVMSSRLVLAFVIGAAGAMASGSGSHGQEGRPRGPAPAPEIRVPTDAVEKAAFDMLDKHCARCHQDGRLGQKLKPAGRFGNVLMIGEMAVDPHLVVAGNPDASLLFNIIAQEKMPYDVFQDQVTPPPPEPTPEELQALRAWIVGLGAKATASCGSRKFVKNADVVSRIAADLQGQRDFRVRGMRYLTFVHHYNACADDKLMEGYRQASVKLLNSLSSKTDVVRLEAIDPEKTIVRFNLDDLGWSEGDWNTILAAYPYGAKPEGQLFAFLASATGSALPYVRADWFTFAAAQPPLYDALLKLPDTAQALEKKLGIDTLANIEKLQIKRAGFQRSGVSANNRMIERHTTASGYFWTSYDFAGNKDRQSLFRHPTGPKVADKDEVSFEHDGGESLFSLPNGFQAYYLSDAKGKGLKTGPTAIVRDPSRRDLAVTNGISCFGCHSAGIRKVQDDVREQVLKDRSFSKSLRDAVEATYVPHAEMNGILDGDMARFLDAMRRAGLNPGLEIHGIEMINGFSKKYEDMLDLRGAAAEFGLTPDEFKNAVAGAGPRALALARRVDQGLVPRDTFEGEFPEIVAQINDEESLKGKIAATAAAAPTVVGAAPTPAATFGAGSPVAVAAALVVVPKPASGAAAQISAFDLALTSDKSAYRQNDHAVLTVTSKKACNLTLVNVDGSGAGTIIFPNRFQQDNRIEAGRAFTFGAGTAFKFRLGDKGVETVVAECNATKTASRGLEANYRAGGFTDLGDYTQQVTRQISIDGAARKTATRKIQVEAANKDPAAEAIVKPSTGIPGAVTSAAPAATDSVARTAIKFEVR